MENRQRVCKQCGAEIRPSAPFHTEFCSSSCRKKYYRKNGSSLIDGGHFCRICGDWFPVGKGQNNKWLCSDKCRRESNAKSVRTFHQRRPEMEIIYRSRTKEKKLPDSNHVRFYQHNPTAPKKCESCGESRVLEIAHKPGFERLGERRTTYNCLWPNMVWVLCPTCHRLIDRMNYSPQELGLA